MSEIKVPYGPVYNGACDDALHIIPEFDRIPFRYESMDNPALTGENKKFDLIIKKPTEWDRKTIPIGIVSKQYALIQHRDLFRMAIHAVHEMKIDFDNIVHYFEYSPNWETFFFSLKFPKQFTIDPGDGHLLELQLICFNSVDKSKNLMIEMGWFRQVCANGLVIGDKMFSMRKKHIGNFNILHVKDVIQHGLDRIEPEKIMFNKWYQAKINEEQFEYWVNHDLKKAWGVKPAVRTYHICQRGMDVIMKPFSQGEPTEKDTQDILKVPGINVPVKNVYAVSQALSWIATRKRDFADRLAWQKMIPGMIESFNCSSNSETRSWI